jgi:hypothetical protein
MTRFLLTLLLAGCVYDKPMDTSEAELNLGDSPEEESEDCELSVRVDAVPVAELPNPSVGDSWTLIMYCDEVILMGPAVLRIYPADLATLDVSFPTFTFVKAGSGEIQYQMGSRRVDIPVTIEESQ